MVESNLNSSEFADKNPVEKANLSMNEPDFVNRISEIEPVYPIAESTANIIATDDLLSKPIVEDVKVEDPRKRGLFTSLTEAVKPDPVVIPQWLRDDEKPREVKASTSPESRGKDKPFGERLGELIDQAGDNLRNMFVVDRREFMKIMGALGLAWKAGELISSTKTQAQETAAQPEVFRMPYEVRIEQQEGGVTSFKDLMIDNLRIDIEQFLGGEISSHSNGVHDIELNDTEFISSESCKRILEHLNINPSADGLGNEEEVILKLKDIFEDLRHEIAFKFSNDNVQYSTHGFQESDSRMKVNPLPGHLLIAKVLGDLLANNTDNEFVNQTIADLDLSTLRNILLKELINNSDTSNINNIEVNYLTNPNNYAIRVDDIPVENRVFVEHYNTLLNPTNLYGRLSGVMVNLESFLRYPRWGESTSLEEGLENISNRTSFTSIRDIWIDIVNYSRSHATDEDTEEFLDLFNRSFDQFGNLAPGPDNLTLESYNQFTEDQKILYLMLRPLKIATNFLALRLHNERITTPDMRQQVLMDIYNDPEEAILTKDMILLVEQLIFARNINMNQDRFPTGFAQAQMYTLRNYYRAAKELTSEEFIDSDNFQFDLEVIERIRAKYVEMNFEGYDSTADTYLLANLNKVGNQVNQLNRSYNFSLTKKHNLFTRSYSAEGRAYANYEEGSVNFSDAIQSFGYSDSAVLHENMHQNDHLYQVDNLLNTSAFEPRSYTQSSLMFDKVMHSFRRDNSALQIDIVIEDEEAGYGFFQTQANLSRIIELINGLGRNDILIPAISNYEELSAEAKSELLNSLYNSFKAIKSSSLSGTDADLSERLGNMSDGDRQILYGYTNIFFRESYQQNIRHRFQGNPYQSVSQMSSINTEWYNKIGFSAQDKLALATQLVDEFMMSRGLQFSDLSESERNTLLRKDNSDNEINLDRLIETLKNLHDRQNTDDNGQSYRIYSPAVAMLAYKIGMLNIQFDRFNQTVRDQTRGGSTSIFVMTEFIDEIEEDMNNLLNSDSFTEGEKNFFAQKLANQISGAEINGIESTLATLSYISNNMTQSGPGLLELQRRLAELALAR